MGKRRHVSIRTQILLFAVAFVLRLGNWVVMGTAPGGDHPAYRRACDVWASDPLGILTATKGVVYAGFTLPYCLVSNVFGNDVWVVAQISLSAVAVVLVYRTGIALMGRVAGITAGLGLAVLWDTFQWTTVLYSDAMFTFSIALALWLFAVYRENKSGYVRISLFFAFALVIVSRPYGFPIVLGWLVYELAPGTAYVDARVLKSRVIPAVGVVGLVLATPLIIERYDLVAKWASGWIIINDQTYIYQLPARDATSVVELITGNHVHLVFLAVAKVVFFFLPFIPRHSTIHMLLNAVTFVPVYGVGMVGLYLLWRHRPELLRYLATPVVVTLAITAVTFVSWDFRYRAPLGPAIALSGGFAAHRFWLWYQNNSALNIQTVENYVESRRSPQD